jgi:TorA maturation chaperone TorD
MGKSRRLEKAAKGGHAKVVNRAAEEGGEKFYERQGAGLDEQQEVVQVAQEAPRAKRLTARQKKKLEKVVEKKQKNAARAQLIADLQACDCIYGDKQVFPCRSIYLRRWLKAFCLGWQHIA